MKRTMIAVLAIVPLLLLLCCSSCGSDATGRQMPRKIIIQLDTKTGEIEAVNGIDKLGECRNDNETQCCLKGETMEDCVNRLTEGMDPENVPQIQINKYKGSCVYVIWQGGVPYYIEVEC